MTVGLKHLDYRPELKDLIIGEKDNKIKVYFSDNTTTMISYEIWGGYNSPEDEKEFEGKNLYEVLKQYNFKKGTNLSSIGEGKWACIATNEFNFDNGKKNTDDFVSFNIDFDFEHSKSEGRDLSFTGFQKSVFISEVLETLYRECQLN